MSGLVTVLSLGVVRRVAISSAEAREFYSRYPEQDGQLALIHPLGVTFGRKVFAVTPVAVLMGALAFVLGAVAHARSKIASRHKRREGSEQGLYDDRAG